MAEKITRAVADVEASLAGACRLREHWRAAAQHNPTNLTKKEVDQTEKALKNKLLTVKWDCEDLEELIDYGQTDEIVEHAKKCVEHSRAQVLDIMNELEGVEAKSKILNKHGISIQSTAQSAIASLTNNQNINNDKYERLQNDDGDVIFDRNQIDARPTVYNNQLHDYFEYEETYRNKANGFNPTEVFNNLTKPLTSVQTSYNDNETILGMLETEYYDPPKGLLARSNTIANKLMDVFQDGRKTAVGTLAFFFTIMFFVMFV